MRLKDLLAGIALMVPVVAFISASYMDNYVCLLMNPGDQAAAIEEMTDKIEAFTANTEARAKRYIEYNAAQGGSVFSIPSQSECEKL